MLTEDYIMRMISQAIAVLMAALGLKKAGKLKEALQAFDQAAQTLLGLNAQLAKQLDDQALLDLLHFLGKLDTERTLILADIYREQADTLIALGQPEESQLTARRSLRLYLEVVLADQRLLEPQTVKKIEQLRSSVAIPDLPIETRMALMDYFDRLLVMDEDDLSTLGLTRGSLKAAAALLEIPDS